MPAGGTERLEDALKEVTVVEEDNRRLRILNRQLETIACALSHDLRAPLRAIDGYSRMIEEHLASTDPTHAIDNLHRIRSQLERMHRMLAQWLAFVRTGQQRLHQECVDLSLLAHDVVAELRATSPHRTVAVVIQPQLFVTGDPELLRELLQNLIGNAWKFTQGNDATALIEVGSYGNSLQTNYFVKDNGVGFAAADALRLFQPFVRLHTERKYEGSGVGLAIVRNIIEAHGGRIWAEGQPGFGATFSFTLPTRAQPPATTPNERSMDLNS